MNELCGVGFGVIQMGNNSNKFSLGGPNWEALLHNRRGFANWFSDNVMKRFFKLPIGISGSPFTFDVD